MKKRDLVQFVSALPGWRALVVGDVMLDEFVWGEVQRVSPEAPVPVVELRQRSFVPGGAGNTAANIASLGGVVRLGGVVGRDLGADQLSDALRNAGVEPAGLLGDPGRTTTTKTRIIAHNQQVVRLDRESRTPLSLDVEDRLLAWVDLELQQADICVLSDYAKGVVSPRFAQRLMNLAAESRTPVIVDPKGTDYTKYRGATLVKPNQHEVERVLKREMSSEDDWLEAGAQLTTLLPGTALLISRGRQGMSLFRADQPPLHIPSVARAVFDVTGAGDTVVAVVALSLGAGASLDVAAHLANQAAGIAVGKLGTAVVTLPELQARLSAGVRSRRRRSAVRVDQ